MSPPATPTLPCSFNPHPNLPRPDVFEIKGMLHSHGAMEPVALLASARHLEEALAKEGSPIKIEIEFQGATK